VGIGNDDIASEEHSKSKRSVYRVLFIHRINYFCSNIWILSRDTVPLECCLPLHSWKVDTWWACIRVLHLCTATLSTQEVDIFRNNVNLKKYKSHSLLFCVTIVGVRITISSSQETDETFITLLYMLLSYLSSFTLSNFFYAATSNWWVPFYKPCP
jgi:hypothetical protein